ncbi:MULTISPECIES: hypothetical protein [Paenibacillus]|uniref:hypothetical protein n=1 Tax=Paenibacillus TaxID=44249 RepID=UPI0004355962|nr:MULTISPECIES: hypothetical protein [Paenibacillus]CDN42209.1 hypothetical protein BN871_AZ_00140 [Paenibacillus sp. P22]
MPTLLIQLSYLVIFIWAVISLVQDLQLPRKAWLPILLHLAVAIITLNWFLHSINYSF